MDKMLRIEKPVTAKYVCKIIGVSRGYADQIDHPLPVHFTALLPIRLTTPSIALLKTNIFLVF